MYPKLTECLSLIARDNEMYLKENPEWPAHAAELEALLEPLTDEELYHLAMENALQPPDPRYWDAETWQTSIHALLQKHPQLAPVQAFLEECFDGELHDTFFVNAY